MEENTKEVPDCCKAGGKEGKSYFMPAILAILLVIAIFQAVQINSMKSITSNAVRAISNINTNANTNANGIDMSGWSEDEKMQYEHHGTLPTRIKSSQPQSQPQQAGMVGGC